MRKCLSCGNPNPIDAIFCDLCGLRLASERGCADCGAALDSAGSCPRCRPAATAAAGSPRGTQPLVGIPPACFSWPQAGILIRVPAGDVCMIGRQAGGADIALDQLDSIHISKRHARLMYHDQRFLLEDLHSTNGTFVGRQRLTQLQPGRPVTLENGVLVAFGELLLRFSYGDDAASTPENT
jgi:hypothetical protein